MMVNFDLCLKEYDLQKENSDSVVESAKIQAEIEMVDGEIASLENTISEAKHEKVRFAKELKSFADSLETFGTAVQAIEDKTSALDKASDHHAKTVDQLMEQMMTIKQEATSRVNDSTADGDGVMTIEQRVLDLKKAIEERKQMMKEVGNDETKRDLLAQLADRQETLARLNLEKGEVDGLQKRLKELTKQEAELKSDIKMSRWSPPSRRHRR